MPLTDVKYLGDYRLELVFESGRKKIHDFKKFLFSTSHPSIKKYQNIELFKTVKFYKQAGILTWGKHEMDIDPYYLP
jgi:hypothetical protein